jgi:hypothetical protein
MLKYGKESYRRTGDALIPIPDIGMGLLAPLSLTEQVRKALLALPDPVLMNTLAEWLDGADERIQYLDLTDQYRYVLGYRVQSDETGTIYDSLDELAEAEPDAWDGSTRVVSTASLTFLRSCIFPTGASQPLVACLSV